MHVFDVGSALATQGLEAILQQEDPHQVPRGLGQKQPGYRACLRFIGSTAPRPQVDDGVRSRIVVAPSFSGHLRYQGALHQLAHDRPTQHALTERGAARRRALQCNLFRRLAQILHRNEPVHEADPQRLRTANGLACQHHLHCRPYAQKAHGADRSPESRMNSQLHFGQTERQSLVIGGHAVPACQCKLQAASQGKSVYRRNCRAGKRFQAVQDLLTRVYEPVALIDVGNSREFLDIRAGDESALLGGYDDHRPGQVLRQGLQHRVQLQQHATRKDICGAAGLVNRQPRDRVGVPLDFPGGRLSHESRTSGG